MQTLIEITDKAREQIQEIRKKKSIPEKYLLRIGIRGAGCAGTSYLLGFDLPKERDDRISVGETEILIDKKHALYLAGITLDYYQGDDEQGFVFQSPDG